MAEPLPAITGKQLIRLLVKDGWEIRRRAKHGLSLVKRHPTGRTLVTIVPDKSKSLHPDTLSDILGHDQTRLGRNGLRRLIKNYGPP